MCMRYAFICCNWNNDRPVRSHPWFWGHDFGAAQGCCPSHCQGHSSTQAVAETLLFYHADNMGLSGENRLPFIIGNSLFNYKSHLVHLSLLWLECMPWKVIALINNRLGL